jgi:hypothetical protein
MGDEYTEFNKLCIEAIMLCINVGIMDSVSDRWTDEVQSNWRERIENITSRLSQEIAEVQAFAESYD